MRGDVVIDTEDDAAFHAVEDLVCRANGGLTDDEVDRRLTDGRPVPPVSDDGIKALLEFAAATDGKLPAKEAVRFFEKADLKGRLSPAQKYRLVASLIPFLTVVRPAGLPPHDPSAYEHFPEDYYTAHEAWRKANLRESKQYDAELGRRDQTCSLLSCFGRIGRMALPALRAVIDDRLADDCSGAAFWAFSHIIANDHELLDVICGLAAADEARFLAEGGKGDH